MPKGKGTYGSKVGRPKKTTAFEKELMQMQKKYEKQDKLEAKQKRQMENIYFNNMVAKHKKREKQLDKLSKMEKKGLI